MAEPTYPPETERKLGRLLMKLTQNPRTRSTVTRAITEVDPSYKFNEHETEDLKYYIDERFEKLKEEEQVERLKASMSRARNRVKESFGGSEEEREKNIQAVEALMRETGLPDYERAAKLYAAENPPPPPKPEPVIGSRWEMPNVERLFTDQKAYELDLANEAVAKIIAARQKVA